MKNKNMLFIVVILVLIIVAGFFGIKDYNLTNELKENKTIYCVMEDSSNNGKMELYYDFKDNHVYRYSVISTYKMTDDFKIDVAKELANKSNEKYKGIIQKVWTDGNVRISSEIYNLDIMTEADFNSETGLLVKDLKSKTRQQIIDSINPMGENGTFKCN
ncbi:MAG: hypothetical protein IJO32_05420 [Bacilli bacterium]|nr:hypothetical protein [Bacilli bacterium]